jgi:hypothetical protein
MPSLIGNKPNQVPSNGDLGTLAFQDANAVNITGGAISGNIASTGINIDSNTFVIDATNNNVGIGTSSPATQLHIQSATGGKLRLSSSDTSVGAGESLGVIDWYSNDTSGSGSGVRAFIDAVESDSGLGRAYSLIFGTGNVATAVERMRLDSSGNLLFNSGYGSVATAYGCRAWVNFNGTGTVGIRASGNVSSITDVGTGFYDVNFTNAMPDLHYAVGGLMQPTVTNNGSDTFPNASNSTASKVRLSHYEDGVARDSNWVSCIIFR